MSGSLTGVQKRIRDIVSNATFHCWSHNINLIICDAAKITRKVLSFFKTVQDMLEVPNLEHNHYYSDPHNTKSAQLNKKCHNTLNLIFQIN